VLLLPSNGHLCGEQRVGSCMGALQGACWGPKGHGRRRCALLTRAYMTGNGGNRRLHLPQRSQKLNRLPGFHTRALSLHTQQYGAGCRYFHPAVRPPAALNTRGLPLRPGEPVSQSSQPQCEVVSKRALKTQIHNSWLRFPNNMTSGVDPLMTKLFCHSPRTQSTHLPSTGLHLLLAARPMRVWPDVQVPPS